MDSVLRKLGLKKGDSKESDTRKRLQKELFAFQKGLDYGFPHKPSAIAYDPSLSFLAIGTSSGLLRVYGRPGVQFVSQHPGSAAVSQIVFLPEQARLVTRCDDNSLHLWEMNTKGGNPTMDEVKTFKMDVCKAKNVTCCCVSSNGDEILLGTDGGTVYVLDVATFDLTSKVFTPDILLQKASEDFKTNPGTIELILQHPVTPDKFLIGFGRGVLVLLDSTAGAVDQTFNTSQQLESAAFKGSGEDFVTSHSDGSYVVWKTSDGSQPKELATTPYGPFPCKAITKIDSKSSGSDSFLIFSGGMPRSSFGDKHTVTVMCGEKQVVFDLTSKVIDFLTISSASEQSSGKEEIQSLLILAEDELVSIDITSDGWPVQHLPYLANFHSSSLTGLLHVDRVPEALWNKISSIGNPLYAGYSTKELPVKGGKIEHPESAEKELLITGHEDGSVLFWDVTVPRVGLLCKLNSAEFFESDEHPTQATADSSEGDSWPPFRKVGTSDHFSDSPKLAIQKIAFCPLSETLVVAGAAGQVIILNFNSESQEVQLSAPSINVVENSSGHGTEALVVKTDKVKLAPGFQPTHLVQMIPAARSTALTLNSEWQLIAVGSIYGFLVYDYLSSKTVFAKGSQVPPGAKAGVSRSRSFQLTLRESIRHLRKRGSTIESKDQPKPKPDEKADDVAKPDEEGKVKEGGKPEGSEKVEETKKPEESVKPDETAGAGEGREAAAAQPEVVGASPQDSGAAAGQPDLIAENKPSESENKPSEAEEPKVEKKPEETKPETSQGAAGDVAVAESAGGETEKTEAVESPAVTSAGDLDDKPREHSVTFAPASPAKHAEGSSDDMIGSPMCAIRSLCFAQTFITSAQSPSATLWVGTTGGQVLIYQLVFPAPDKRAEEEIQCTLVKEVHLRHRAPVVAIFIVDRDGRPLPAPLEVQKELAKAPDMTGGHRVLVCSQEQLKLFSLPSLKAYNKYKVAVHHNEAKISQVTFANFKSKSDAEYAEKDLVCITNHGDVAVFTVPQLRLQAKGELLSKDGGSTLSGSSCVLTRNGFGFYQPTPSQLEKFSLCAASHGRIACALELKEGMRPVEVKAEEPVVEKPDEKTEEEPKNEEPVTNGEHVKNEEPAKNEEQEPKIEEGKEVRTVEVKVTEAGDKMTESGFTPAHVSQGGDMGLNDSLAIGDITADSVKIHYSEEETSTVITCHDVIENKMVVRTTERTVSDAEGIRTESKTVVEEMSSCTESSVKEGMPIVTPVVTVGGQ